MSRRNQQGFVSSIILSSTRHPRIPSKFTRKCSPTAKLSPKAASANFPYRSPKKLRNVALALVAATATFFPARTRPSTAAHHHHVNSTTIARAVPKSSKFHTDTHAQSKPFKRSNSSSVSYDPHAAGTPFAIAGTSALVASAVAVAVTHPIDTVKTMRQARASGSTATPTITPAALYRGVTSNILKEAPNAAIYLAMYEVLKSALLTIPLFAAAPLLAMCVAGMLGDAVGSIVRVPAEIVNKRLQLGLSNDWHDAIKDAFLSENGVEGTLASWFAVLWRDVPYGGLQIAGYELVRLILAKWGICGTGLSIVAGAVAGLFAGVITTPADVLVTRMSTQSPQCYLETRQYMSASATWKRIIRDEGFGALWTGALARGLFYMPMIAIFFMVYEMFKHALVNPLTTRMIVMQAVSAIFGGVFAIYGLLTSAFPTPIQITALVVGSSVFRRRKGTEEASVKW